MYVGVLGMGGMLKKRLQKNESAFGFGRSLATEKPTQEVRCGRQKPPVLPTKKNCRFSVDNSQYGTHQPGRTHNLRICKFSKKTRCD